MSCDTVAPTLVFIFYELARHWECAERLFREISNVDIDNLPQLESLMYLNGFINEVLRLHPPVPTGGYRETPSEGLVIAGHYVPGNVTIVTPRYTLERCTLLSSSRSGPD